MKIKAKNIRFYLYGTLILLGISLVMGQMMPDQMMYDPAMRPDMRPDARRREQEMITCPDCGRESPVGTEYCPTCAYDLSGVRPDVDSEVVEVEEVEVPKITVIEGEVVICRVTGKVLEEPVKKRVPLTERDRYDELDEQGEIFGNITIVDDKYISPEANMYRRRVVDIVDQAMQMDALQFSGEFAAAITDRSVLENIYELELTQVDILSEFRHKELQPYRVDPDDPYSEFHPVYLPRKPELPPQELLEQLEREPAVTDRRQHMDPMMMDPAAPRGAHQIGLDRARSVDQRR